MRTRLRRHGGHVGRSGPTDTGLAPGPATAPDTVLRRLRGPGWLGGWRCFGVGGKRLVWWGGGGGGVLLRGSGRVRGETRGTLRVSGGPSKRDVAIWRPVRLGGMKKEGDGRLLLGVGSQASRWRLIKSS